jgi:hypothetical protein
MRHATKWYESVIVVLGFVAVMAILNYLILGKW